MALHDLKRSICNIFIVTTIFSHKNFTFAIVIGLSSVPGAMAGPPVTIIVDDDGEVASDPTIPVTIEDCDGTGNTSVETSIQDAIDLADPGDTVVVCPHDTEYDEAVDVDENDITVEGIAKPKVNGSSNGDSPAFTITEDGVHLTGFEAISDDDDCILVDGAEDVRLHGNIASGCDGKGIRVTGDSDRITISGNRINDNGEHGIRISGENDDSTIKGNTITGNDDHGLKCSSCDNIVIHGNTVIDNDGDGIKCSSCTNSVIQGNVSNLNDDDGIAINGGSDDNLVKGNTANGNEGDGIEVRGEDNTISNNTTNGNDSDGIDLSGDSEDNVVTHNTTNGNDDVGIEDDGTSNTFDKNRCRNNGTFGSDPIELCKPQGFV